MKVLKQTAISIFFVASNVIAGDLADANVEDRKWIKYAEQANGDVIFYDQSRVKSLGTLRHVWNGVRYKTSVMGASSFLSLLEIDCRKRTEKILESTFFTDKNWEKAAMQKDMAAKKKTQITVGSATERLAEKVCIE